MHHGSNFGNTSQRYSLAGNPLHGKPAAAASREFKLYIAACVTALLLTAAVVLSEPFRMLWLLPASTFTSFGENKFNGVTVDYAKLEGVPKQCFGVAATDPAACSGNGRCDNLNTCVCQPPYAGQRCQQAQQGTFCGGVPSTDAGVCSGRGRCVGDASRPAYGPGSLPGMCVCAAQYTGASCETSKDALLAYWNQTMQAIISQ